jgi:hypothetical protein
MDDTNTDLYLSTGAEQLSLERQTIKTGTTEIRQVPTSEVNWRVEGQLVYPTGVDTGMSAETSVINSGGGNSGY